MRRYEIVELATSLIEEHLEGWTFGWDRATRRVGCCKYGPKLITLSWFLVSKMTREEIVDIILHEIAHALVGFREGHGPRWRRVAQELGCNGNRCHDLDTTEYARYVGICKCSEKARYHYRHRKTRGEYRCRRCNATFFFRPKT